MTRRYADLAPTMLAVALVALPILYAAYRWSHHGLSLPLALAQTAALVVVFVALRERQPSRGERIGIAVSSATMIALALAAPTAGDPWAYVGYAMFPHFHDAYNPPPIPFHGDFAVANQFLGMPMAPCVYGPFWLFYDRLLVHWVPTMAVGIAVLKAVGALTLVAIVVVLRRLAVPFVVLALVAVNPALIDDAVWCAHNDFMATLLSVAAMLALSARRTPIAVALVVFGLASPRTRTVALGAAFALAAVVVLAVVGARDYLHALTYAGSATWQNPGRFAYLHVACAVIAVCLAGLAFVRARIVPSLAWTFATLSTALYSWYYAWGLPYAARGRGSGVLVLFAAWPLQLALNDGGGRPLTPFTLFTVLLAAAAFDVLRAQRLRFATA
ncbi:MAG TPA: hypothetical protein VE591_11245 [Candidatus Acidoferrum sp.]|nr:hypothetical protein [Candidatus Acidoferrum sp.]